MAPFLTDDFISWHIENYLTMKDVYCSMYDEDYTKEEAKQPVRVKWVLAVLFCNDLSRKHHLEPCYYLNGKPVSAANCDRTGKGFECRYENNGWRLPTKDEAEIPIFCISDDCIQREGWEWTNDRGEWLTGESRLRVRASEDSDLEKDICKLDAMTTDPEEKLGFRMCRGIKSNEMFEDIPKYVNSKLTFEEEKL